MASEAACIAFTGVCNYSIMLIASSYLLLQGDLKKEQLLKLVLLWEKRVMNALVKLPEKYPVWSTALGQWLSEIRMDGVEVTQTPGRLLIVCHSQE